MKNENKYKYKSIKRKFLVLAGTMIMAVLLAGCGEVRREDKAKSLAESYLGELKEQVSDETLYLTDSDAEHYGEMTAFIAYSEKYDDDFRIFVNPDDSISDSYFAVSLKDSAVNNFAELVQRVLPDEKLDFDVSIDKNTTALGGRTFATIKDAHEALDNSIGLASVVISYAIPDEKLDRLLKAMQDEGFYGDLAIKNDERVFHISEEGINYTRTDDPAGEVRYYDWYPCIGD